MANKLSKRTRRIVTCTASNGKSSLVRDEQLPADIFLDDWPEFAATEIWYSENLPIQPNDDHVKMSFEGFDLPNSATRFMICDVPPINKVIEYQKSKAATFTHEKEVGYHETNTVDYAIILAGKVTLILEDTEVNLNAGDTVVQKGAPHAWHNRSNETCKIAFIMIASI